MWSRERKDQFTRRARCEPDLGLARLVLRCVGCDLDSGYLGEGRNMRSDVTFGHVETQGMVKQAVE